MPGRSTAIKRTPRLAGEVVVGRADDATGAETVEEEHRPASRVAVLGKAQPAPVGEPN